VIHKIRFGIRRLAILFVLLVLLPPTVAWLVAAPAQAAASTPTPPWWNGVCDVGNNPGSHPIGASYNGVQACGPGPTQGGTDHLVRFYPGAWGEYEWECVELVMRYLYLVYGIAPYSANGNTVVSDYGLFEVNRDRVSCRSPGVTGG